MSCGVQHLHPLPYKRWCNGVVKAQFEVFSLSLDQAEQKYLNEVDPSVMPICNFYEENYTNDNVESSSIPLDVRTFPR